MALSKADFEAIRSIVRDELERHQTTSKQSSDIDFAAPLEELPADQLPDDATDAAGYLGRAFGAAMMNRPGAWERHRRLEALYHIRFDSKVAARARKKLGKTSDATLTIDEMNQALDMIRPTRSKRFL